MDELVKLSENPLGIKGFCRIELRDAETGVLTDFREGHNFVSPLFANVLFKQMQKMIIGSGVPNGGIEMPGGTQSVDSFLRYLVLTDSTMAESPTTETNIPGNMVGYAQRATYAGTDTHLGSLNTAESFGSETLSHWVFDFATNSANGTIGSICWTYAYPESTQAYNISAGKTTASNWTWMGKCARIYTTVVVGDGYFWGNVGTIVYKIDPVTFQELASYTLPVAFGAPRFVVSGGYLYYNPNTYYPIKFNLSTSAYVTAATQFGYNSGYPFSLHCTDGTYIYMSCNGAASAIVGRLRMSDNTLMETKTIMNGATSAYMGNLTIIAGQLYNITNSSSSSPWGTYTVNYATGTCTFVSYFNAEYTTLFADGTNIYTFYSSVFYSPVGSGSSYTNIAYIAGNPTNIKSYNLMARKLLGTPITKTSAKTMKIIYEFTMS